MQAPTEGDEFSLRVREKIDYTTSDRGCWLWKGAISGRYGSIYKGLPRRTILAHRASYTIHIGPIPSDMNVLHKCDNTLCVNPEHLFLGTQMDNVHDMIDKGRHGFERREKMLGQRNGWSKLTIDDILEIKKQLKEGQYHKDIAEQFGVVRQTISAINNGKLWGHV